MKVYIVLLEGGGDIYIKVVDEETFNWICSDDPGQPADYDDDTSWVDQIVPAAELARQKVAWEEHEALWHVNGKGAKFEGIRLSRGSWENDRAIFALPAVGYNQYDTIKEAMRAIKDHGDEFEDEYQGCMY